MLSLAQHWLKELCSSSAASSHRRATSPGLRQLPEGPSGEPGQGTAKKKVIFNPDQFANLVCCVAP